MFNFTCGIPAVVNSLKALAYGMGFHVSTYYGDKQVAIIRDDCNILADMEHNYVCFTRTHEEPKLIICASPQEVEHEYLELLQKIGK